MPPTPPKHKNLNPVGVLGAVLFGGLTMILTMLAMLFFPLAAFVGSFLDILSSLNPFKRKDEAQESHSKDVSSDKP